MSDVLRSPFPWFGGKGAVAQKVWACFGAVRNYVEPFFGSGAVLLARPQPFKGTETINDADGYVCNFWRALQASPDEVAKWADWPVSELDLHARHLWLVNAARAQLERLRAEPEFFDPKIAGWWVWGLCQWIGSGWCHNPECQKLPHLGNAGIGIHRPSQKLPHLGNAGRGQLYDYFALLSARLRGVRVCCGDWSRVCGPTPTVLQGLTAVFLDPPYSHSERDADLYAVDQYVAADVRAWCRENGSNKLLRIALCGYAGEGHEELESLGWTVERWKANGGYSSQGKETNGNPRRERIWYSKHCQQERVLFPE